jgi:hypothetical protein
MTYQYAIRQENESVDPSNSRFIVENELTRLDDASARIRNDMVAYANELVTLKSELRAVEHERADLATAWRC